MSSNQYDLTEKEMAEFSKRFNTYDKNGDGEISMDELKDLNIAMDMKYSEDQLEGVMRDVDKDGNGSINLSEYLTLMQREKEKDLEKNEEELKHDFNIIDEDHNGYINKEELQKAMTDYLGVDQTEQSVDDLMNKIDIDRDGQIDYPEFVQAVLSSSNTGHNKAPQFTMKMVEDDLKSQLFTEGAEIAGVALLFLVLLCGICKLYQHIKYRKARLYTALNVIHEEEDLGVIRENQQLGLEENALL